MGARGRLSFVLTACATGAIEARSLMRSHGTDADAESRSTLLNLEQIILVQTASSERGLL